MDIRQRIEDLGVDKTISDINLTQLCNETQTYDYIWLTQLWTPSKFNYKNNINAEQTDNYREFESIKEYQFDPNLGTKLQFTNFVKGLKAICIHMKFLGEFSFYVGQDSSLLQNKTRFLRRPQTISYNDQNQRYDDKGLVWAINSEGKTIPYTAVWNYFQYPIFMDIKDILENIIIKQHQLDGVVFLQPSLGLFEVANSFYPAEIDFYGDSKFMGDFYENYKLKDSTTKLYFMGDLDNINAKPTLLRSRIVISLQSITYDNLYNYTFISSNQLCHSTIVVTEFKARNPALTTLKHCVMQQPLTLSKQCIKFNISVILHLIPRMHGQIIILVLQQGLVTTQQLKSMGFDQSGLTSKKAIFAMVANGVMSNYLDQESNRDKGVGFSLSQYDIFEVSFDAFTSELVFRKSKCIFNIVNSQTSLFRYQQLAISYQQYRFIIGLYNSGSQIEISFPYQFTDDLKSSYLQVNGDRHLQSIKNSTKLQIGQVLQSINQLENDTTLNIYTLDIPPQSIIGLGICNKDLMIINNHQISQKLKSGGYLLLSNGSLIHSSDSSYNQTTQGYSKGNIISITFQKSNYSIIFEKNNIYLYSMFIGQYVRNLHFCVGFYQEFQSYFQNISYIFYNLFLNSIS
ncbi:hypothetical protein pb186bvf_007274 [Paramecium bursaria]